VVRERNRLPMKLRILGYSDGIGEQLRTTSMLLDNDILIDAGTGVGNLSLKQLTRINHVFVKHSHLDRVSHIPFLVDTVGWMRNKPITVRATLEILKQHNQFFVF
jgi:phosphoribosyl 1,2-cyclic phosphodiesterase